MHSNIVFLLSAPYSGATLFSILLNLHPKISSDGEIFPYVRGEEITCSCGNPQRSCEYYSSVATSMRSSVGQGYNSHFFYFVPTYCKIHSISRAFEGFWINDLCHRVRNFISMAYSPIKKKNKEFLRLHLEFIEKSLAKRNAAVYLDGSKSMRRAELFVENKLTFKIIHLVRDGRAFCSSFIKNNELQKTDNNLMLAARVWRKYLNKVEVLRARFPGVEIMEVRYHDICHSPERELKTIYEFLDLGFDHSFLDYSSKDMHILGNRMRFTFNGEIREDLAWRERLTNSDVNLLERVLEKELKRYDFVG